MKRANMRERPICNALLTAGLLAFGVGRDAHAQADWHLTTIDVPGAVFTDCYVIAPDGKLVGGGYRGSDGLVHGWVMNRRGEFATIDYPGSNLTKVQGINSHGDITGNYHLPGQPPGTRHGYLWHRGELITFDPPGSVFTEPYKINNRGEIAGRYCTTPGGCPITSLDYHGFVRSRDGEFTLIDFPDGINTKVFTINERGQIFGVYTDLDGINHLFLLNDGVFTTIDFPGAYSTAPDPSDHGMNSGGDIVAYYCDAPPCAADNYSEHGFLRTRRGEFFSFDIPGVGATVTWPTDISYRGDMIVGDYCTGLCVNGNTHGFLLSRQEPGDDDNEDCDGDFGDGDVPRTEMPARLP